jgi:flagellar motor switch protein FliN/FliY
VLTTAGLDSAVPEDQWESSLEIVRQTLSGTVQSIQSVIHKDLGCEAGEESDSYPTGTVQSCTLRFGDDAPLELYVVFEDQLVTAVDGLRQQPRKPATAQPMDLLYDVQLPVSISFGRTHLPLKEVIKLTSGSIVELNRAISEPVEVIVNNCVIARGEVVVIDGNYGIRINQIINRSERLRTLN